MNLMNLRSVFTWLVIIVQIASTQPSYSTSSIFLAPPQIIGLDMFHSDYEPPVRPQHVLKLDTDEDIIRLLNDGYVSRHNSKTIQKMASTLKESFLYMMRFHIPMCYDRGKSEEENKKIKEEQKKEVRESIRPMIGALYVIAECQENNEIHPEAIHLKISVKDKKGPTILRKYFKDRKAKIAYLPMKGDPWQIGHIWMIMDMLARGYDKVLVMLDNSSPIEKEGLSSLSVREALGQKIYEMMGEYVERIQFQKEVPGLYSADGETICYELIKQNLSIIENIDLCYLCGGDHINWVEVHEKISDQKNREIITLNKKEQIYEKLKEKIDERKSHEKRIIQDDYLFMWKNFNNGKDYEIRMDVPGVLWLSMENIKKDFPHLIANFNLDVMFSHREEVDGPITEKRAVSVAGLKGFDNENYTIHIRVRRQPMDTSSSAVRKDGAYHTILWATLQEVLALKLYLFADERTVKTQDKLMKMILKRLCPVILDSDDKFERTLEDIEPTIEALLGPGINGVDGTLVQWQRNTEDFKISLGHAIGINGANEYFHSLYDKERKQQLDEFLKDRITIIREKIFAQALNIVNSSRQTGVVAVPGLLHAVEEGAVQVIIEPPGAQVERAL